MEFRQYNIKFIGPSRKLVNLMSDNQKQTSHGRAGVPQIPGSDGAWQMKKLKLYKGSIVIPDLKAAAAGGGRGMRVVEMKDLESVLSAERRL